MKRVVVVFMDGVVAETYPGYARARDGVLSVVETYGDGSYRSEVQHPLVNVRSWKEDDGR